MEPRISFITLGVSDIARSRAFYQDVVGWQASEKGNDNVAFFQLGGVVLSLFGQNALLKDAGLPSAPFGAPRVALAYNVRERLDVDATLAALAAKGATITQPAHDAFWGGRSGYFADPDGHMWEVAWNPGGYLDDEGRFRF